ncbi:MAG: hypothetical protein LAO79_09765 [Acidobacteriia bacterium]|nr:hypothetical protein [Terriglobia bacterium]
MENPALEAIAEGLGRLGKSHAECAQIIASVAESAESQRPVRELKAALQAAGIACDADHVERVLLVAAARESARAIEALRVPVSVRELIRKQHASFGQASGSISLSIDAEENDPFVAACKIATLRRFPAGPIDWVVSGMPRSWFLQMPRLDLPRVLRFVFAEFGGLKPAFYVHIAHPPRNRTLVIEKEVRRAYYRMAQALELQPEMKGIMCATWLHDPAAFELYPYLKPLNEPYLELGGRLITNLGPAPLSSGFLKFNSERRELYERGELKLKSVVAMWPRKRALEWMRRTGPLE